MKIKCTMFLLMFGMMANLAMSATYDFTNPPSDSSGPSSCDPSAPTCLYTPTKECQGTMCFTTKAAKAEYEKKNNCLFSDGTCGGKKLNVTSQCCVNDASTGKPKIRDKQYTAANDDFDWEDYKKECKNMRQSEAKPDALWAQCKVGQKHSAEDDWPVKEVISFTGNPKARSYCVDGCSTPPDKVEWLTKAGVFIFADKDNPTGNGPNGYGPKSSFYEACKAHDLCYQTCGGEQETCDDNLLSASLAVCNLIPKDHFTTFKNNLGQDDDENTRKKCISAANKMHSGLQLPIVGGIGAFNIRRQQYCQCC